MIKAVCYIYLAATTTYPNLNIIERKFKRQILMPDPIILATTADFYGTAGDFTPALSGRGRGWPPWGASSRTTGSAGSSYPPGTPGRQR